MRAGNRSAIHASAGLSRPPSTLSFILFTAIRGTPWVCEIRACRVQKRLAPLKCGIAPSAAAHPRVTVLREMAAVNPTPACPITGHPAVRLIQSVSSDLLNGLWRASFGVATEGQLGVGSRFGLWESPCGLVFFDPMIAGDASFYRKLYPDWGKDGPWAEQAAARADYAR